jgi:hypothetical protein
MWKINLWLIIVAVVVISISRRVRLSGKYERTDKRAREISPWKSLDQGIDPTVKPANKEENKSKLDEGKS